MIDDLNSFPTQPDFSSNGIFGGFMDNGGNFTQNFNGSGSIADIPPFNTNQSGVNINDVEIVPEPEDATISASQVFGSDSLTGIPISGTVVGLVDNDEFLLQDANGTQILVDTDLPDTQFLGLVPGEQVNVLGTIDDDDFEAYSVTRLDGSSVYSAPQGTTISGTVTQIVDNDEFLLVDANGLPVLVDTELPDTQFLGLVPGEQVNVFGTADDDDFEAYSVTRLDGSPVFTNTGISSITNPQVTPTAVTVNEFEAFSISRPDGFLVFNSAFVPPTGLNPIFGTVVNVVDNDEFFLQDANGTQFLVEAEDLPDNQFLTLAPGEPLNVLGLFDNNSYENENEFEAFSISRSDGSLVFNSVFVPPTGLNSISGTVVGVVDNDEFILDVNGNQILVEAEDLPDNQFLTLNQGEAVNVLGLFDNDGYFDDDRDGYSGNYDDGYFDDDRDDYSGNYDDGYFDDDNDDYFENDNDGYFDDDNDDYFENDNDND
ncbi:hypothetical protein [Okeania sp.]|uniref:hypothetical protein n=1 Tax=Okeania sp. TaxID=3100323 RepID=UPI002B4B7729|nr:hypothetical protein [Okeania sp.]MEB3342388.1 hypothetical protein [Okeania sp.]